ncbi:MAG: hypothetical protein FJX02_08150 [Alphaproteobacteria bacterium]|nr:hypothetical protein [Alphaproteobacteria bacterium]
MSIIRLSCRHADLHAALADGSWAPDAYDASARAGRLGRFEREDGAGSLVDADARSTSIDRWLTGNADRYDQLGEEQPVAVMVHGFLFDPEKAPNKDPAKSDNPHSRVFHFKDTGESTEIREHTTGWPRQLGFKEDDRGRSGLAVAFGWMSQPGFASSLLQGGKNFYARAYENGREAAWPLVCMLDSLRRKIKDRQIDLFCHSLGSVVVVRALAIAAKHDLALVKRIGRVVILGGSEYSGEAQLMYGRVAKACADLSDFDGPQVFNIVSRENAVLDLLAENFGPKSFFSNTQVIGHNGLQSAKGAPRWIDIQIDKGDVRDWGGRQETPYDLSGDQPGNVWDHWYYYTHRGNMAFYRDILRTRAATSLHALRNNHPSLPEGVDTSFFGN